MRFDDHLTLEPLWDGGITYDGNVPERGGDFEALSTRMFPVRICFAAVTGIHLPPEYAARITLS